MTRKQKNDIVDALVARLAATNFFYVVDADGLTVEEVNDFRKRCFHADVAYQVVKNTLLGKALEQLRDGVDYAVFKQQVLKKYSGILFAKEAGNVPAQIIQAFRKERKLEKPRLKGACVDQALFIGEGHLDALSKLKSKHELIGGLMSLLQSPMVRVTRALQSGGEQLMGALTTLSNRGT